jgi:hypothetical protein
VVKAKAVDQGLASAAAKKVTSPVTVQAKTPAKVEEEVQMMIAKSRLLETDGTPLVARPLVRTDGQVAVTLLPRSRPMVGTMLATTLQPTSPGGNPQATRTGEGGRRLLAIVRPSMFLLWVS